ncbi:MAG TPA: AAA family ATPase [Thermomicrobiaceae bacterium]|nr:AAA family ATPase [Thermomicrobiaceae bacterium]
MGRQQEQGLLRQRLDQMLAGRGGVVLVGGEAGIGKTMLVEDLSVQAEEAGALALWGHAYDLSVTPPYGPWLELLHGYSERDGLPPLPPFVDDLAATAALGSQERLFAAVRDFFQAVAARQPLLLILEDQHWGDEVSLELLRSLARQIAQCRLLVVVTYRSDELRRQHPLYARLPVLVRETQATRLEVRPLLDAAHHLLLRTRYQLSEADDSRLAHYLVQHAEGNPLYAGELLRTLEEQGVLLPADDGWQLGNLAQVRVPPLLRQVIDMRVERLGDAARELLAAAAVIGQTVPYGLWQAVSGADEATLAAAVERAAAARLLEEFGDGSRARFVHALIREALYQGIVPSRRRRLHRLAGESLAALPEPDADAVAHHFRMAGDERAADWLIAAGERAERAYAWMTAAERFEAALPFLATQRAGVGAGQRGWLLYRLAVLRRFGDAPRSVVALEEAGRLATEAGDTALAAYALVMGGHVRCLAGDLARGIAELEAGIAAVAALPAAEHARRDVMDFVEPTTGASTLVYWLPVVGRLAEARALGEEHVATSGARDAQGVVRAPYVDAFFGLGDLYACLGEPRRARQAFDDARAGYDALDYFHQSYTVLMNVLHYVIVPYHADDLAVRRRVTAEAERGAARVRDIRGALPSGIEHLPLMAVEATGWDEARRLAGWAAGRPAAEEWATAAVGAVLLARGDVDPLGPLIAQALPLGPNSEPGFAYFQSAVALQRAAATLALRAGDLPVARAWLTAHDRWLAWSGSVLGQAEGASLWAKYFQHAGDAGQARRHAEQALAHASAPRQPLALLAAQRLLGQIETDARRFGAAEARLQASLTLAQSCQAPFERALTLLEIARLRLAQGKPDAARALLGEVRAICEPLGARPALAQVAALEARLATSRQTRPFGLSERELEVLRRVAQGLTDAQIAGELFISRRTVTSHLTSILNKLGVSSRAAAVAVAARHDLL